MVVPTREALLGTLLIPDNDPYQARVEASPFGRTLANLLWDIAKYQPDIQMLHYALMPDHLHFIWYVKHPLTRSIREVVSGFWIGAKKLGRAYSYDDSSFVPTSSRHNYQESLCEQIGKDAYYSLSPIFTEMPFIRSMAQYRQLQTTIDYLDMNPQRLATKRLKPGFFCVQPNVEINGRIYRRSVIVKSYAKRSALPCMSVIP